MNPQRTSTVLSGDVRIVIHEYGIEHALRLVLVHGYPDSSEVWQRMVAPLSRHFHVVTYDVRGCGQSSAPASRRDYSLFWLGRDFRAVIDAACPEKPLHVFAHDWGSIQSWESVTDADLQQRIRSFTTISGPCLDHVGHWIRHNLQAFSAAEWTAVGGQFLHSWYIWLFQLPLLAPSLWKLVLGKHWHRLLTRSERIAVPPSPTQLRDGVNGIELYRANIARLVFPRRRNTRVPVQLIVPLRDDFVTPELVRDCTAPWVSQLWRREIDATHWAPLSHPEQLVQMVVEFVDFIEGGAASPALVQSRVCGESGVQVAGGALRQEF